MGQKNVLKLGDFGSSVRLKGCLTARGEVAEWVGTPAYMAPEVQTLGGKIELSGKDEHIGYGRASDIWSIGCVVLEMCTGKVSQLYLLLLCSVLKDLFIKFVHYFSSFNKILFSHLGTNANNFYK